MVAECCGLQQYRISPCPEAYATRSGGDKLDDVFTALMEVKNAAPHCLELGEIVIEISVMSGFSWVLCRGQAGSSPHSEGWLQYDCHQNEQRCLHLLKNPTKLACLWEEIESVLLPADKIAPDDKVRHLPYLRAYLDEAL